MVWRCCLCVGCANDYCKLYFLFIAALWLCGFVYFGLVETLILAVMRSSLIERQRQGKAILLERGNQ